MAVTGQCRIRPKQLFIQPNGNNAAVLRVVEGFLSRPVHRPQLEQQYQELHSEQHVTKVENVKLKQNNDELARELDHTSQELMLAQDQLVVLQEQSTRLHEEKEM